MIVHLWTITVCNSPNRHSDFMCETYNIYPNIICALDCLYMVYACFGKKKCMNFFFFFFFPSLLNDAVGSQSDRSLFMMCGSLLLLGFRKRSLRVMRLRYVPSERPIKQAKHSFACFN